MGDKFSDFDEAYDEMVAASNPAPAAPAAPEPPQPAQEPQAPQPDPQAPGQVVVPDVPVQAVETPEPAVVQPEQKTVPYETFQDQQEKLRATERRLDQAMDRALTSQAPEVLEAPENLDPEVLKDLRPYFDHLQEPVLNAVQQNTTETRLPGVVAGEVEGFTEDMMPKVIEEYSKLTPEQQAIYGQDTAGAVALAQRIVMREGVKPPTTTGRLKDQSRLEVGTPSPQPQNPVANDNPGIITGMKTEDFEKLVRKVQGDELGDYYDPDF